MLPNKPESLKVEVIEAKIKKIKDSKHEDGRFQVDCLKSSEWLDLDGDVSERFV